MVGEAGRQSRAFRRVQRFHTFRLVIVRELTDCARFAPARAEKLPERQWTALLQLTAIELFALRRAGRDLAQISHARTQLPLDVLINNEVTLQSDSADHVTFLNSTAESGLLVNISTSEEPVSQESLAELVQGIKNGVESGKWAMPSTESWSAIALQDPAIKLAVRGPPFRS